MDDVARLIARVDALEARAAHQDRAVDDLNETITGQWKEIERLNRQIARLDAQLKEIEAHAPSGEPEPPPPHY